MKQQNGKQMKISPNANNNSTGDTIFKQAHSTTSNNGRSNQTQSTAFSVRTTSSGRQKKGKLVNGNVPGSNLQTSQSPFTDNHSGGGAQGFTRKRSVHASSGRPVYE